MVLLDTFQILYVLSSCHICSEYSVNNGTEITAIKVFLKNFLYDTGSEDIQIYYKNGLTQSPSGGT
jgi:hypothetical protein